MFLDALGGRFSHDLAIDLGTSNTLISMKGKGIVLNEPSVVAIKRDAEGMSSVLAVGLEAKRMLGRAPERVEVIRPVRDGVIADFEITGIMLRHFIRQVRRRRSLLRPRIIISVPIGVTPVEKRAVRECAESAGASEVYLIEEPIAAAIGAGLPITEPKSNMVVDIGGGTTEVTVISLGGIVFSRSVRMAGDRMDESIVQYINRKYNFMIGLGTAEVVKMTIGNAYPFEKEETMLVRGRDLASGIPRTLTLGSIEVRQMLSEQLETVVQTVLIALEQMPPELSADILDRGIVLTGGGSLLRNLDVLLRDETRVPVRVAENPAFAVAVGAGIALDNVAILRQVAID